MEDLLIELASIKFWVAVVLVGFIINILSAYLKPIIDKNISSINVAYRARVSTKQNEEKLLFESLTECSEFRNIHRQEAIFERTRSVWFVCFGIGLLIITVLMQL